MRKTIISLLVLSMLFVSFAVVFASSDGSTQASKYTVTRADNNLDNNVIPENVWRPGENMISNELDLIGDTIHVGNSYYNAQHNGTIGRMMDFYEGTVTVGSTPYENVAFFTWMDKPNPDNDVHIKFNRAYVSESNEMVAMTPEGSAVDAMTVAAYVTMGFNRNLAKAFPTYHGRNGNDDYVIRIASELGLIPGVFTEYSVPLVDGVDAEWPRAVYCNTNDYLHVVSTESPDSEDLAHPQRIYYSRHTYDPITDSFTTGEQTLLEEWGENISADVAVSSDGSRVVVGQTVIRDHDEADWTQYNNDIYLFTSDDAGATWNDPINLTNFIAPDLSYLPDTTLADQDTLRAYSDCNIYFDNNDVLHVAFTTSGYFSLEGTIFTKYSWIYHWDEVSNVFTLAVDGKMDCYDPGSWNRAVDRPNMYQDPETGILYMVFQQMGIDGASDDTLDVSDSGFANGEVGITASCPHPDYYGKLWANPLNITQSRWTGASPSVAGEARSETNPSIALNNDGDYLNLFYMMDYLGGNARQDEGEYTQNHAVWHRIAKDDVISSFESWTAPLPLHIDGAQHWEDDYDYDWENEAWIDPFTRSDVSVGSNNGTLPEKFNLEQNYPNPFNPTTSIAFTIGQAQSVKLAVYDVLGREVAQLVNKQMTAGRHTITFNGSDLASGVYFLKLQANDLTQTRKMVLMK